MSKNEVDAPICSAPSDRLALSVGWVRPGAGSIGGTTIPSHSPVRNCGGNGGMYCFEGNEE
jgi:hypothetical protein